MSLSSLQRGDIFLATAHDEAAVRDLPTTDAPLVNALRGLLVSAVLMGRHMIVEATEGREPLDCGHDLASHEPALDKPMPARGERDLAGAWSFGLTLPPRLELDDGADRLARLDAHLSRSWDPITDQLVEGERLTERRAEQVVGLLDGGHHGEREC